MARPPWNPTATQLRKLEQAADLFRQADRAWQILAELIAEGVPKDRIPEYVPHSRATVLRKLAQIAQGQPTTNGRKHRDAGG